MSSCPLCQQQVEINDRHFGALYTCPQCAGIFFVSWDGTPEVANHESDNLFSNVPNEESPVVDYVNQDQNQFQSTESSNQYFDSSEQNNIQSQINYSGAAENFETGVSTESFAIGSNGDSITETQSESQEMPYDFGATLDQQSSASNDFSASNSNFGEMNSSDSSDLSDIANFGNADVASSNFHYSIMISEIDSGSQKQEVIDAMTDSRFVWDVNEMISKISDGKLLINNLTPIKTFVLIQRLQNLSVKVEWSQHVLDV